MERRPTAELEREADEGVQPKRRLNALAIVSLSLFSLIGALVGWLTITYEPNGDAEHQPVGVVLAMPPAPAPQVPIAAAPPAGTPAPEDSAAATVTSRPPSPPTASKATVAEIGDDI